MSNDNTRFLPAIILIAFGAYLLYLGQTGLIGINSCSGFQSINPLCWVGLLIDINLKLLGTVLGGINIFAGVILMLLADEENRKYFLPTLIFGSLLALDIIIPDPIPIIDELILGIATSWMGIKMVMPDTNVKNIGFG